ncbi:MAG: TraB/GumN family protein [Wenzhouxiangellaceae bacterium]|nr:TraB/GumN family protein [Wenzhouxiangellaceae bacterium]
MIETTDSRGAHELFALAAKADRQGNCRPLSEYIAAQSRQKMQARFRAVEGVTDQMPESAPAALFMITTLDSARTVRSFDTGVDSWIWGQALASGKKIISLETAKDRLHAIQRAFGGESCELQARLLEDYIAAQNGREPFSEEDFLRLVDYWRKGDMDGLAQQIERHRTDSDVLFESLTSGRNRIWLPRIVDQLLHNRSTLVVVGSAHLIGPDNLLQLLENHGFTVRRIQ